MSRTPIVRPISWLNAAINLVLLSVFMLVGWLLHPTNGILVAIAVYLFCSLGLRSLFAREHRAAIALCKQGEYGAAIPHFQNSLRFFERHPWVDHYRAVTMLSAAGFTYREMALVSMALCYAQIGDGKKARDYYEKCLREFPDNNMAQVALRLMDAACKPVSMAEQP
jgi:tetratricopeptide (TPR) repeat protein